MPELEDSQSLCSYSFGRIGGWPGPVPFLRSRAAFLFRGLQKASFLAGTHPEGPLPGVNAPGCAGGSSRLPNMLLSIVTRKLHSSDPTRHLGSSEWREPLNTILQIQISQESAFLEDRTKSKSILQTCLS